MKKEVKIQVKKEVKKIFLLEIINAINQGKSMARFCKEKDLKKQNLNYYLRKLKDKGMIKRIGYGVWETTERSKNLTKVTREVRGHGFLWKIKLPKIKHWEKRIEKLSKAEIPYKLVGAQHKTPRIIFRGRKIWLGDKYLIIYEPESFIGHTALESKKLAVFRLKQLLEALENKFKISLKFNGNYKFSVRRQHYALMKNLIAIQCNKEGKKIYIHHAGDL
jgi:hypothetical protein